MDIITPSRCSQKTHTPLKAAVSLLIKSHCVALLSLYQMMCLSLRMETSSTVALSASIIIPAFTGERRTCKHSWESLSGRWYPRR